MKFWSRYAKILFNKIHLKIWSAKCPPLFVQMITNSQPGLKHSLKSSPAELIRNFDRVFTNGDLMVHASAAGPLFTKRWHIEAETKWPPFSRRHIQINFLNENIWILIKISLKFVHRGPINNIPALVQIMVSLLTHICVARPQWVKMCYRKMAAILFLSQCVRYERSYRYDEQQSYVSWNVYLCTHQVRCFPYTRI